MHNIGWFSTGRDKAARQLLQVVHKSIQDGGIDGKILFVFSSRKPGESTESDRFFQLVNSYNLPLVCLSSKEYAIGQPKSAPEKEGVLPRWRLEYDREVMRKLERFTPQLCMLAGYMLIVGEEMCHKYTMINLHPAKPGGPKGSWQEVIWELIDNNARETGVMMHLVTPELDRGPVIAYCTYSIRGKPFDKHWAEIGNSSITELKQKPGETSRLFRLIRQHGLAREFPLIVSTLAASSHGEINIKDGRVFDNHGKQIDGYDLTDRIDKMMGTK